MIQVGGVYLPDGETHLVKWMKDRNEVVDGKLTYQYHKIRAALEHVRQFRTAIDVGAHCGLWSMHLAKRFQFLHAFEPVDLHRVIWTENMRDVVHSAIAKGRERCFLIYPYALGEFQDLVSIHTAPTSSGDSWVKGKGDIQMKRLDDFDFQEVDFIKLDCEGYELFALRGGEELLKRCRPCVIVEQKPGKAQQFGLPERGAVEFLQDLGAKLRREISGDFILSWDA